MVMIRRELKLLGTRVVLTLMALSSAALVLEAAQRWK